MSRDPGSAARDWCAHRQGPWVAEDFLPVGLDTSHCPHVPRVHKQALPTPPTLHTHQPRTTLTEVTWSQLEVSTVSSQTSLLLPWQPASEKRIIWRRHRGVPQALPPGPCLLALACSPPHTYLPRSSVQLALDLQCWALAWREAVSLRGLPPYCLPATCHSKDPTRPVGLHFQTAGPRGYHACSQPPGASSVCPRN